MWIVKLALIAGVSAKTFKKGKKSRKPAPVIDEYNSDSLDPYADEYDELPGEKTEDPWLEPHR